MKTVPLIVNNDEWLAACEALSQAKSIAVDTESNGLHGYPARICLFQFATREAVYIVDPVALGTGKELRALFANPAVEKIFHSCGYDVRSLDCDFQAHVSGLFDTAIAAQFLGSNRLGLANVLQEILGLQVEKRRSLQKMDWGMRPLPADALAYAVNDVLHLHALRDKLCACLEAKHRLAWVLEECRLMEGVRHEPPEPSDTAFFRVKGCYQLNPHQRAILKELYLLREALAHQFNRPPFKIMGTEVMFALSRHPSTKLSDVKGMSHWLLAKAHDALRDAIQRGRQSEPIRRLPSQPGPTLPWTDKAHRRLALLKEWRIRRAAELGTDASLLWPLPSLERIALAPDQRDKELFGRESGIVVRVWQQQTFGKELAALMSADPLFEAPAAPAKLGHVKHAA